MNSIVTVALSFLIIIHCVCIYAKDKQTVSVEDDLAILNKYLEMDQKVKTFFNSGMKQFLPYILAANEHVRLSPKCTKNIFSVVSGLRNLKLWALSFLDASGKLSDGFLRGNLMMLGNFDQCLNTTVLKKDGQEDFHGKHCIVDLKPLIRVPQNDPNVPHLNFLEVTKNASEFLQYWIMFDRYLDLFTPKYGICVPSGCSQEDVQQLANYYSKMAYMNLTVLPCQEKRALTAFSTGNIVIMVFFSFILAIGIIATGFEYYFKKRSCTKKNRWTKLLLCFSITSNFQKVMDTTSPEDNRLACIHGIRVLTTFYMMLIHRFAIPILVTFVRNGLYTISWSETFFSQIVTNSYVTLDTFIFMAGLLNAYLRREKEKNATKSGLGQFFTMIFFRIWRFYPAYICTILFAYIFVSRGPIAPMREELITDACDKYWWGNLLFIHNFFRFNDICLQHTWYISAEMQLFIFAFVPITLLLRNRNKGYILNGILIIFGIACAVVQAWILKAPARTNEFVHDGSQEALKKHYRNQFLPFPHIAAYFIGVLLGEFLSTNKTFKIPVVYQIIGWLLASFMYISPLFMAFIIETGPEDKFQLLKNSSFIGFRSVAVLGVAWMVFCCVYGYGGIINYILTLKVWVPISRLSYFMYLIHVLVQVFYSLNGRFPIELYNMNLIWLYMGDLVMVGLLALVLSVLIESPNIALMKMAFEKISEGGKKSAKKTGEEVKNGSMAVNGINSYYSKNNFEKEVSKL